VIRVHAALAAASIEIASPRRDIRIRNGDVSPASIVARRAPTVA
jgi:hypothetical protein